MALVPLTLLSGGPELAPLVGQLVDRRIIVALDEDNNAPAAALTLLSDKTLGELVQLDAIIATVDAVHWSTRLTTGQPIDNPTELNRLAIADRILVARSRDVAAPVLAAIGHVLRSINQTGPIIAPAIATCSIVDLLDLGAWTGPPTVGPKPDRPSPFLGPDAPAMVVCRTNRPIDLHSLERWLESTLATYAAGSSSPSGCH